MWTIQFEVISLEIENVCVFQAKVDTFLLLTNGIINDPPHILSILFCPTLQILLALEIADYYELSKSTEIIKLSGFLSMHDQIMSNDPGNSWLQKTKFLCFRLKN